MQKSAFERLIIRLVPSTLDTKKHLSYDMLASNFIKSCIVVRKHGNSQAKRRKT